MHQLIAHSHHRIIDYVALKSMLSDYRYPRAKITSLLKSGDLIRVKKGLYVLGRHLSSEPYTLEVLANLIYGPSYTSLEYALAFYGMIPEHVKLITSVTCQRDKYFDTPVGRFSYRYLNIKKYPVGVVPVRYQNGQSFLMATPEKALADKVVLASKGLVIDHVDDVMSFLTEDLRIDVEMLRHLHMNHLREIAQIYSHSNFNKIVSAIASCQE